MKVRIYRVDDPETTLDVQEVGQQRTWEFYWNNQCSPDFYWEEVSDDTPVTR